ncbi:pseudouridine synthase [Streptococcus anginosus]|uniref:rRNA pseudouridine synthase n=1 Tax=Streptococcus anginosus TaxID=1328 RepID=A0AAP2K6V9_STRAP|nr:pseudouridine synthase [Streptococcus anginosus]MBZ2155768.1 rRNA pseudouridine synthase [Streptococcus anginosus]
MRLDKFLVEMGFGSRTEVKRLLKKKQVLVNGKIGTSAKIQIDENQDEISVNNQVLIYKRFVYYLLNKPKGVISATEDDKHRTVLDLLDENARQKEVFPVGWLDIDTHGLLLLTNNGALAHAMLSPKKHVAKVYRAKVDGIITEKDVEHFEAGIELKDFTCQPAKLTILEVNEEQQTSLVEIIISEGKFHQVKRMVQACGKKVTDLERLSMGPLTLDRKLEIGTFRRLTKEELEKLTIFGVEL